MKRAFCTTMVLALSAGLALPTLALGKESSPLSIVPGDAIAFACIQNLKQADERVGAIIEELGLAQMVPFRSLLTLLREYGPMGDGLDENGALALVMLAAETPGQLGERSGLIISATDPAALLESLNPEPAGEGTSKVLLFGKESYAVVKKGALVIAPNPEVAKAFAKEGPGIDSKLKPRELKALSDLDVACWVNAAEGFKLLKPMLDDFMGGFKAMSGAAEGSVQAIQVESMEEQIGMLCEGAESLCAGLSLGKGGLGLRFAMTVKPGTELAKMIGGAEATKSSLLVGLPAENYIFASGQVVGAEQAKEGVKWISTYLDAKEVKEALGEDAAKQVKTHLEEWYGMLRGFAFSVSSLPPGPDGLIGVCVVCKVADAKQWTSRLGDMIEVIKGIETENEEAKAVLGGIQYKTDAATIEGASVTELSLDLSQIEDVDPEEIDQMKKVAGKDGLMIRIAAVDGKHVAMAFGGGEARMATIITHAKSGKTPLSNDAGIKRVADKLPAAKLSETYLALDRILSMIRNVNEAIGEGDAFPFTMTEVNAPIAVASSGGKGFVDFDLYLPMELIVAVKNTAMQAMGMMMGGGMQPGMGGPPGGVDIDMGDEDEEEDAEETESAEDD